MWFCYSFLRTEPEIPLLWIFISHKRMQQLILNAPIDIIYHLSYLQYFDVLKINNVIWFYQYLLYVSHGYLIMCILHGKMNIKKIDLYAMLQSNLYAKNHSTMSWATSSHLQLNESSSISYDIQIVGKKSRIFKEVSHGLIQIIFH